MFRFRAILIALLLASCWAQESDDAAYLNMRRTACLVLSRYYSNSQKVELDTIIQSLIPDDQSRYINKMYAVSVEICESQISQTEVQEVPIFP
jgi:hypothetical protein